MLSLCSAAGERFSTHLPIYSSTSRKRVRLAGATVIIIYNMGVEKSRGEEADSGLILGQNEA
jgi:hypothetical protein